ncbi:uncharacterized protein [Apostichopus japonicus]|uniref:uncharacterized protein isoform X3 n=1 Tax=Stichopus japonicus TaxID=307972 RepID=UPI003AB8684A
MFIDTSKPSLGHLSEGMLSKLTSPYVLCPLVLSGIILGIFCFRNGRTKKLRRGHLQPETPVRYNLKNMKHMPRLSGLTLRLSAKICTSFIGRLGWTSYIFKQVGFSFFRSIHYVEEPSFTPNPSTFEGPKGVPEGSGIDLESYVQAANKETDFHFFSVSDYYHAYRNGTTTPSEVADWVIARVEESNSLKPGLCAVTQMDQESARKMARESSERVAKGCPCSVLDGIPILIKEELNCAPYHAKCGTSFMGKMPVIQDCTIAYKLKQAGAVIIGMTNMHELGMSVFGYNIDPDHGMPRNPYDPNHYTGGSSSGSAAAVASGLVPVAIGTDGGGSVRVPATLCGNVGLKPTFGRVSLGGNEVSCHSVVHAGPICSNVNDTALVYTILAGPDPKDPLSINQPQVSLAEYNRQDLSGLKIGIDWEFFRDSDVEVVRACEAAVDHLRTKGAEVVGVQIPELQELRIAHTMIIYSEMRESFDEYYAENLHKLNPDNQVIFSSIGEATARDYITANKQRTRSIHFMKEIFKKVDVLITPACGMTAPKMQPGDEKWGCSDLQTSFQIAKYMLLGNFTGVPGLVVPIAYGDDGLPIGLQVIGKWWEEDKILSVGKFAEEILQKEKPRIFFRNDLLLK